MRDWIRVLRSVAHKRVLEEFAPYFDEAPSETQPELLHRVFRSDTILVGETSLSIAAETGDIDTCMRVLSEGALVNVGDRTGRTPLMAAASKGQLAVCRLLLITTQVSMCAMMSARRRCVSQPALVALLVLPAAAIRCLERTARQTASAAAAAGDTFRW